MSEHPLLAAIACVGWLTGVYSCWRWQRQDREARRSFHHILRRSEDATYEPLTGFEYLRKPPPVAEGGPDA